MFVPLIASGKVSDKVAEDALQDLVRLEEKEEKKGIPEKRKPEVQVPMSSIVGMRKSNKTAMGCIVSAGLQVDVDDGSVSACHYDPKFLDSYPLDTRVSSFLLSRVVIQSSIVCWPCQKAHSDVCSHDGDQ